MSALADQLEQVMSVPAKYQLQYDHSCVHVTARVQNLARRQMKCIQHRFLQFPDFLTWLEIILLVHKHKFHKRQTMSDKILACANSSICSQQRSTLTLPCMTPVIKILKVMLMKKPKLMSIIFKILITGIQGGTVNSNCLTCSAGSANAEFQRYSHVWD